MSPFFLICFPYIYISDSNDWIYIFRDLNLKNTYVCGYVCIYISWQIICLQCRKSWFNFWVGKIPAEGIGHPPQYSWASLVAQMVKNLPAMQETWVGSLGWEDALKEGMETHFSILDWRIPMDRGAWWATVYGITKSQTQLSDQHTHTQNILLLNSYCILASVMKNEKDNSFNFM